MIAIKDYKAIYEYRKRRQDRVDGKRLDDEWKTIKGTHVLIDDEGSITKGPENLRNLSSKKPESLTSMKKVARSYDKWASGLNSAEKDAVRKYVALGHSRMFNDKLRTGKNATRGQASDDEYKALDSALEKSTIPENMTLFRGTSAKMFGGKDPKDMIGETIVDKGYESTSMTGKVGDIYSDGVICKINAPKGSKGAYVDEVGFGEKSDFGEDANNEILLPRNSEFKITGVETDGKGRTVVTMDYIGQRKEMSVGKEMSPINNDYDYEDGDTEDDFTHKNLKKLKKIYDEQGMDAVHDEWYKFRMADSTKDIHQISKDEADEIMYDNVRQSIYDGWFRAADSSYKPQLTDAIVKNPEMRNAALNLAYENYRNNTENPLSFEEFLVTPIKMYRGEKGQKHVEDDIFDAYTFDPKMARHFAGDNGTVTETEVRPIDTYGSMRAVGEAEIWVPRQLSPVGYKGDSREDGITWERYDPLKWALEDYKEEDDGSEDLLDSIIQEAEMVKLFDGSSKESDRLTMQRCIESIQIMVLQLTAKMRPQHEDSAFFAGELNGNLGERNILYPEVQAFRERRKKRMDARADEEEWITIKGTHVLVDENGEAKSGGKLKGMTFKDAKPQKKKESTSKSESVPDKVAYSGSTAKRDFNKKIEDIIKSSDDESIKIFNTVKMLDNLPKGTRIDFPDSWTSDDGTKNYGIYEGNGIWKVKYGRKKDETYTLSNEGMAGYMLYEDENERAKITKVPEDEATKEKRAKERGTAKHYAMNPDGSINGKHTNDFHNEHVSQEERDKFSKDIKETAFAERGFDDSRSLYRGEANKVGDKVEEEIRRRAALRKKDKENAPINDRPQVEDIYDVLRDCRDFGMPDGFKPDVHSDLSPEKTEEIIKEAFDRYPTDWLKDAKYTPVINIVDGPGRPICTNGRFITLYTKRNLGDSVIEQNDRALVNDLAHELGHYMEDANQKVGDSVKDCLWSRGAGTEIVDVEPGYQGYKDSFFHTYMGKIYSHGGTEVLSMLMEYIGAFSPMEILSGQEYDMMKGKYGRKKNDKESLGYILGVLAGL